MLKTIIDGNSFCTWSFIWGDSCGAILRNPGGTAQAQDEYQMVRPDNLMNFPVAE